MKRSTWNPICPREFDPKVTQCCMWPLKVDFDEFNWDWILFPRSYETYICSGNCQLGSFEANFCSGNCRENTYDTKEALDLMLLDNNGNVHLTNSCCAPTEQDQKSIDAIRGKGVQWLLKVAKAR